MDKKNIFIGTDEEGKEVECEILISFHSSETNKIYIIYTDNTTNKDGNVAVYASTYNPKSDKPKLMPIKTEREWKVIETLIEISQEKVGKNEE